MDGQPDRAREPEAGRSINFRLPIFDWRLNIARCDEIC